MNNYLDLKRFASVKAWLLGRRWHRVGGSESRDSAGRLRGHGPVRSTCFIWKNDQNQDETPHYQILTIDTEARCTQSVWNSEGDLKNAMTCIILHIWYINQTSLNCRRMLGFDQKLRETKDTVMGEVHKMKMTIMMILMMMMIMIIVIMITILWLLWWWQ